MSKPYDATSKDLIEADPAGWVAFLSGLHTTDVSVVDADVSTVTTDADKVIRIESPRPWLLHLEFTSRWEEALDRRVLRYNALLHYRHGIPVASHVVILRSEANMPKLKGTLLVQPPAGHSWEFRYGVLRIWERPVADFLNGPLGMLPLAPLADVRRQELEATIEAMKQRIAAAPDRSIGPRLWAANYVLMGLRYERELIEQLHSGVMQMEESVTYQAILRRGRQEGRQEGEQAGSLREARKFFLRLGEQRFGSPSETVRLFVARIEDPEKLEALGLRLNSASSWDELLRDA